MFPTECRGMAHGFSAAVGKLGALSADIILALVRVSIHFANSTCIYMMMCVNMTSALRFAPDFCMACSRVCQLRRR